MRGLFLTILFCISACANNRYAYSDISAGYMPNQRYELDGEYPAWISIGVNQECNFGDVYIEFMHRSNLDKGWPLSQTGEPEYSANSWRLGVRIRIKNL